MQTQEVKTLRFPQQVTITCSAGAVSGQFKNSLSVSAFPVFNASKAIEMLNRVPTYRNDIKSLRLTGVHPTEESKFTNPLRAHHMYEKIDPKHLLDLRTKREHLTYLDEEKIDHHPRIGNHSVAVGVVAWTICELLNLAEPDKLKCVSQALLHDGSKLADVLVSRIDEVKLKALDFDLPAGKEVDEVLLRAGVPKEQVDKLQRAAGLTGHGSLVRFLEVHANTLQLKALTLADKITHLADDVVGELTFVVDDVKVRRNVLASVNNRMIASEFPKNYKYLWEKGLAVIEVDGTQQLTEIDANKQPILRPLPVGCYADVQVAVTQAISAEILARLNYVATTDSHNEELVGLIANKMVALGVLQSDAKA